jgi:DNA polymerase-3 subunit gamma/tau
MELSAYMYKALYRKWRPQTFDDVISQSHVTSTLKNQIVGNKTAHAYLFTGSRGTGKTTCARIFAKALCCTNPHDGNPCLQCENCLDAESSRISDIIEIDAASNNSVEDVRDLREGAVYLPERCKYKVYIIDEVHMLSSSAFNALLKIMEEPPEFVKFILATTEIHKVPATILSRCQRFDFKRILPEDISARLLHIAQEEGFTLSNEASLLIAKLSDGGMRDAISTLDQASAYSNEITEEVVSNAMGIAGREYLFETIEYICDKKATELFNLVDSLYMQSKDLSIFCADVLSQMRNVMVLKVAPNQSNSLACMPSEIERLTKIADRLSLDTILHYMNSLEKCYNRLAYNGNKRVELEMSLIDICNYDSTKVVQAVQMAQPVVIPQTISGDFIASSVNANPVSTSPNINRIESGNVAPQPRISQQVPNTMPSASIDSNTLTLLKQDVWQNILSQIQKLSPGLNGALHGSIAHVNDTVLAITVDENTYIDVIKHNINFIKDVVSQNLKRDYKVFVRTRKNGNSTQNVGLKNSVNDLIDRAKNNNIPIEQVD